MDPKMSVGVDTNAISLSGPWNQPTPSPPPKLTTPLLAVDAPTTTEWTNPLSAAPFSANHNSYPVPSHPTGLTPRFSPTFNSLTSPGGVSADIANITDPTLATSSSIADLFASPEYPLTPVSAPTKIPQSRPNTFPSKPPAAPTSKPSQNHIQPPSVSQQQQQQQHPIQSASQPLTHNNNTPSQQQPYSLPLSNQHNSYPTSSAPVSNVIPTPPYQQQQTSLPTSQSLSQTYHYPKHPHQQPQPVSSQQLPTAPIQSNNQTQVQMQPTMSVAQPIVSSLASTPPYVTSAPLPVSNQLSAAQPLGSTYAFPNTGPGGATSLAVPPTIPQTIPPPTSSINPVMSDPMKPVDPKDSRIPGHRSVLGSGISSSAVREAQARARIKADDFARQRKRERGSETVTVKKVEKTEDDSKLSPDDLKQKRYKRRLALNRESAAVSRVRRKEYVKLLEEKLVNAEDERIKLLNELMQMRKEHDRLRGYLCKLEEKPDDAEN